MPPAARSIPAPAHTSRIAGPRPSRVPRMSNAGAGPRPSLAFSSIPPPAVKRESLPPPAPAMPAHLTEEEINARVRRLPVPPSVYVLTLDCMQIAKAVELEVARRLEEREEAARKERSMSVLHEEHGSASAGSLQSLPPGLLSPLLKKQRHSADDELKQRLEELESKLCVPIFATYSVKG